MILSNGFLFDFDVYYKCEHRLIDADMFVAAELFDIRLLGKCCLNWGGTASRSSCLFLFLDALESWASNGQACAPETKALWLLV